MKINVTGVCEVKATKVIPGSEVVKLVRPIAGKKATIELEATATGADLIAAARIAFEIAPAEVFAEVSVKRGTVALNATKTLAELSVRDGTSSSITYSK